MYVDSFGFKINAEPFELLAKSLPSSVLAKHKSSLLQIEALLFGQAGMLDEHFEDKYPQQLQNEYVFLKQKFKLTLLILLVFTKTGKDWKLLARQAVKLI